MSDNSRRVFPIGFHPAVLFAANIAIGWLLGFAVPFDLPMSFLARMASGGAFLLFGAGIGALAIRTMGKANTPVEPNATPRALVATGPFRFSRNPLYVALVSASIGIGLMLAGGWILIGSIALAASLNWLVIPVEERVLAAQFPEEFAAYRRGVRRWI